MSISSRFHGFFMGLLLLSITVVPVAARAQTITGTASAQIYSFTQAGRPIGPISGRQLIGQSIKGAPTPEGLVPVMTAKGVVYVRSFQLTTSAALPPAPNGPCVKIAAAPGDNTVGATNGLGGGCAP